MTVASRWFDTYIAVDWSARGAPSPARPTPDAIWIGIADVVEGVESEIYVRTRSQAIADLRRRLRSAVAVGRRVLIGFDLDFGFPSGFAASICPETRQVEADWRTVWRLLRERVSDGAENENNRFEVAAHLNALCGATAENGGPMWGCPSGAERPYLRATSPTYPFVTRAGKSLRRLRWTEVREPRAQPVWKLIGSASVGGQTLVGIPAVAKLRFDESVSDCSRIWPFETGFGLRPAFPEDAMVLFVEIWPGILRETLDPTLIRDRAQVRATVRWMKTADECGHLADLLGKPSWLTEDQAEECVREEGWVLGSGRSRVDLFGPRSDWQPSLF
jgi:precorrin-8X/cobalt-precorrin-8 methylmutase